MSNDRILAVDIDLHRITAWSSHDGVVCSSAPDISKQALETHTTVLVEIAGPYLFDRSPKTGEVINRLKWTIFNIYTATRLSYFHPNVLCSPASWWTKQYPEPIREAIAQCAKSHNHDVRACICMIAFYKMDPTAWVPLQDAISRMCKSKKSQKANAP